MIRVEGIKKVFNPHSRSANEVLKGVSFTLPDKGLVAIFGKSGSGKTTLLNIMGGLDKQDSGKIYIAGEEVGKKVDKIRNAKIGFIFQNYYLESGYTIEEIMHNAMVIAGFKDEKEIKERTEKVLSLVKLDRFKHKTADALSGGQKQRVAIARALIKGSDVILADEPTGNLDSENTTITMEILKEISKTQLVVLVTHEVNLIYKYADSHIKLIDGELQEDGTLDNEIEIDVQKHNIYADEKQKRTYNVANTNIDVYGENAQKAELEIFNDTGKVYIRAGKGVEIIDNDSEKQVVFKGVDEKQERQTTEIPKFSKSTSAKNGKLFTIKNVWKSRHFAGEEKAYSTGNIFKQIFIFMLAVVMCFFSFYVFEGVRDKNKYKSVNSNNIYLDMSSYLFLKELDEELYEKIDFFELDYKEGTFGFSNQQSMSQITVPYAPKSIERGATKESIGLIFGQMPKNNEVLISEKLADDLKFALRQDEYQTNEALLLLHFDKKYRISGIVKGDEPYLFMKRADYVNFLGVYDEIKFTDTENLFFEKDFINQDTFETINSYTAQICLYEGETLDLQNNQAVIEINRSSTYLMMRDSKDADYKIEFANRVLLKTPEFISIVHSNPTFIREFSLNRDEMNTDIKVYVNENTLYDSFKYIFPNLNSLNKDNKCFFEVETKGGEQLQNLKNCLIQNSVDPINIQSIYDDINDEHFKTLMGNILFFVVVALLLYIIYYFIEKSGSIKSSKEYGIFRAIGINKSNLLFKEIILTIKENIITYIISFLLVATLLIIRYAMMNVIYSMFILLALSILIISMLLMIGISLIPYLFVLTKTPSQILTKYDI